jgi:hypothetical protein
MNEVWACGDGDHRRPETVKTRLHRACVLLREPQQPRAHQQLPWRRCERMTETIARRICGG